MNQNLFTFVFGRFWSIYTVKRNPINHLQQNKDLSVTFSTDFNWTEYYRSISAKAYQTLGLIRRTFKTNCIEAIKQMYTLHL